MVYHVRNTAKSTRPLLIRKLLVPNTNYTLGLLTDEGEFMRLWEGFRIWTFFFDENLRGWSQARLVCLKLLPRGERYYKVDGKHLPRDDVLRA
jgi:hypothetical protein